MPRLRLALCLILAIPLLSACKTVRIHTHNPPGHAYGHKKHKHGHSKGCGHWLYDGPWHNTPQASKAK